MITDDTDLYTYEYSESDVVLEQNWGQVREIRESYLKATDWIVIQSQETGLPISEHWKAYRQTLRDIPQAYTNPNDVVWPEKPTL
ncbi:phage tail assembly chaperone [Vibrio splendidus]|uniref:phage tail assembly chaperone n=1 Tax=Vibrio splendidus TaxID=29497 RepID=UPI0002E733A5|nr:phage tail assembly chaperone [Vibrio splendidus]OEF68406.1 hypothetical protein A148_05710 [Vibrio splendidus 1F-157]